MAIPARKSRTSSCSRSERFSSGIRTTATVINSQVQSAQESSALLRRRSEPALPSGTPEFQHGVWLPASPPPKYKAHAPSEENHEYRGSPVEFSKPGRSVRPCPESFQESAATRDVCAF